MQVNHKKRTLVFRLYCLIIAVLFLYGCSSFDPVKIANQENYQRYTIPGILGRVIDKAANGVDAILSDSCVSVNIQRPGMEKLALLHLP